MRKTWLAFSCALALGVALGVATAGERQMGAGCQLVVVGGAVTSSASDADCVWGDGDKLTFQCDGGVFYTKDGTTPTAASPAVTTFGDPYPFTALRSSVTNPLKIVPYGGGSTTTCNVFISDRQ